MINLDLQVGQVVAQEKHLNQLDQETQVAIVHLKEIQEDRVVDLDHREDQELAEELADLEALKEEMGATVLNQILQELQHITLEVAEEDLMDLLLVNHLLDQADKVAADKVRDPKLIQLEPTD